MSGKTPQNAAGSVWLFDPAHLMPGDLVFERSGGGQSAFVAAATGGPFSHVLIWAGGSDFIEAMPTGVRSISFARVVVAAPNRWRLMRVGSDLNGTAAAAAIFARNETFKKYDVVGAGMSVFGGRKKVDAQSLFCSQLAARSYEKAGLNLLPGKRPEQITPNALSKSSVLNTVEPVFQELKKGGDAGYPVEMLDRSAAFKESGPSREFAVSQAVFKVGLAQWRAQKALPTDSVVGDPGNLSELLDLISTIPCNQRKAVGDATLEAMKTEGYFDLAKDGLDQIQYRLTAGQDYTGHISGWEHSRSRHQHNAMMCRERFQMSPHPIWIALANMYEGYAARFGSLIMLADPR